MFMPNPFNICISILAIFPVPMIPAVFPCISKPNSPCSEKFPSRVRHDARGIFRLSESISATVYSATAYGE